MMCTFAVFISSVSQIILKKSANKTYSSPIREIFNIRVIIAYGIFFLALIINIFALKGLEYKYAGVIESLGYIFILLLSRAFLNEKITKNKIIGTTMILVGVIIFYI